jgi:hypothetical protein
MLWQASITPLYFSHMKHFWYKLADWCAENGLAEADGFLICVTKRNYSHGA